MSNKNRGITIITLVITIIILLILAGISIATLIGNDGLINKAKKAAKDYENAQEDELAKLSNILEYSTEDGNIENIEDVTMVSLIDKINKMQDEMNNLKTTVLEDMYPVGSIYISTDLATAEDVATKFGGTWESYGQGRTLIGVGTGNDGSNNKEFLVNSTGGEYNHTLDIYEIPSHAHSMGISIDGSIVINHMPAQDAYTKTWTLESAYPNYMNVDTTYRGGGYAHNNIQPYIAVYMWKRVS